MTIDQIAAKIREAAGLVATAAQLAADVKSDIGQLTASELTDDPVVLMGQVDALHADIKSLSEQIDALRAPAAAAVTPAGKR